MKPIRNKQFAWIALVVILSLALPWAAFASEVDVSVVDVTVPVGSVTLAAGQSGSIVINMSVTGAQAGTATFTIYRDWTLSGDVFSGSNAETFTVPPRTGGAPATTFETTGTVYVAPGQAVGSFTLVVGAFDITNSNTTGAKLQAGDASNYQVIVTAIDTTPPVITYTVTGTPGNNGWYTSDVTVTWTVTDPESTITSTSGCDPTTIDTDTPGVPLTCTATSAGGTSSESVTIKRDATTPTISASVSPARPASGWWNTASGAPTVSFTCDDETSGVYSCTDPYEFPEGEDQEYTGTAEDYAGNTASATVEDIDVDLTAPGIIWSNGPQDGESYYFGFVPAEPTCTATDALSGPDGCAVTGYGTTVGSHTLTATAYDEAGNETVETRTYTVLAWTLTGFYQPVSMDALNTVKGGSTVPLKFNVYAGDLELTDVALVTFSAAPYTCGGSLPEDPVTMTTTGNTSLRYDFTDGQFIQNWKTPKSPGKCYLVTMTTSDGSKLEANFKLK
jgi:VCBS repeat-containing protein